jgi:uncharacterized membrane protein
LRDTCPRLANTGNTRRGQGSLNAIEVEEQVQQFIFFLGRFHVLVLHLPLGILVLAIGFEMVARRRHLALDAPSPLEPAMPLIWGVGALSALATVALGYMHASEPGFTGPAVNYHRWAGTALAFTATLVWAWRGDAPRSFAKLWPVSLLALLVLLFVTGHLGGALTHGPDYLTQFAPGGGRATARPKVTDVAMADIYLDVVGPLFAQKCTSCHNEDKRRGGLSLLNYAAVRKGGEDGEVIKPGDPKGSELYRRVTLAPTQKDYMPENHKNPPTPAELEALRWWIEVGAPGTGKVADLKPTPEVRASLRGALGL